MQTRWIVLGLALLPASATQAAEPERDWQAVELVGKASDHWDKREWSSYYWREDFSLLIDDEGSKRRWRVISREPTPAYQWRMGTTYTGLKVDWNKNPRIKVIGVKAVDRIPAEFYHFKLDEKDLVTALVLYVEVDGAWKEFYVNNWFHRWGKQADATVHALYAGKPAPYDIYGFARAQAAPFDKESQAIIDKNKDNPSLMFHGRIKKADNPFGYEIQLIDLIGRDTQSGGAKLLHGDAKSIPLLDTRKPEK